MKKQLLILVALMFVSFISLASALSFDNIKSEKVVTFDGKSINENALLQRYKPIEIANNFGFGSNLFEGYLSKHDESCGVDCESIIEIKLGSDSPLIDAVEFLTLQEDGSWIKQPVRSYQFYIKTENKQIDVNDYETQCIETGVSANGTVIQECSQVLVGSHKEDAPVWTPYNIGEEMPKGTYTVKLDADKKPDRTVDWVITTQGKKINEWAVWGDMFEGTEYQLVAQVTGINEAGIEVNGVLVTDLGSNYYKINSSNADDNVSRALIMQTLFKDGRANSTYINATNVYVNRESDNGRRGTYAQLDVASNNVASYTGTFAETTNNFACSYWGYAYRPGASVTSYGTDTSADDYDNPTSVKINRPLNGAGSVEFPTGTTVLNPGGTSSEGGGSVVTLCVGAVTWVKSGTATNQSIDYYVDKGFPELTYPTGYVTLNSPADSSIQSSTLVTTNASAVITGGATLVNMSLWTDDGGWGIKNTTVFSNTNESYQDNTARTGDSNFNYTVNALKSGYVRYLSALRSSGTTIQITARIYQDGELLASKTSALSPASTGLAEVNLAPSDYLRIINEGNFIVNIETVGGDSTASKGTSISYSGTEFEISSQSINTIGGFEPNQSIIFGGDVDSLIKTWNYIFPKGSNIWNVQACDSDGDCGFASSNYTFTVDNVAPNITLNYPTSLIDYGANGGSLQLNFTATDSNLDDVWYNYNGTNVTIAGATSGIANLSNITLSTKKNVTIYANDTAGNLNTSFFSWNYQLFENNQWYSASTEETSTESFVINVDWNQTLHNLITGTLYYDGTPYTASRSGTGSNVNLSVAITIPNVDADVNKSFYWSIGLVNSSGTKTITTNTLNQTVRVLNMSLTGFPETVPFINFTVYDEETGNELNASFEATFTYSAVGASSTNSFSYEDTTGNTSRYSFAFDPADISYNLDTNIRISAIGYATRYYNWEDLTVSNTTTLKSLYLLDATLATSFIIEVIDAGYNPITGAVVEVERYQEGLGSWINTEVITTNSEGKAIAAHIVTEDAQYRFKVYQNGVSVLNSSATTIACEATPCTVQLVVPGNIPTGLDELEDLDTSLTYSTTTNIFTFTYEDTSSTFSSAYLKVYRFDSGNASNNALVCWENGTTSAEVLACDISSLANGTYKAEGYIVRSDTGEHFVEYLYGYVGDTIYNRVGIEGVLWTFFLFIGIVMAGVLRPALGIIFGIVGVVGLSLLNIISIGITAIVAIIAIGIILLMNLKNGA